LSSEELTAELLERRKALLAEITALRALFEEKLRGGNTVEVKRVRLVVPFWGGSFDKPSQERDRIC